MNTLLFRTKEKRIKGNLKITLLCTAHCLPSANFLRLKKER